MGSSLVGSLDYMSPEQLAGHAVDHRTDLWSLGCILFESLTGKRALSVKPAIDGRTWDVAVRWELLGQSRVPRDVRRLLRSCLADSPDARPRSAEEVRDKIDSILRARSARRRIVVASLGTLLFASALTLALWPRLPQVDHVEIREEHVVQAVDVRGRVVWERQFVNGVRPNGTEPGKVVPLTRWIDHGKTRGLLFGARDGANVETLYLLDYRRGSVIWSRPITWNVPVNAKGELHCVGTKQIRWPAPYGTVFMITLFDFPWYGSALQFFSTDGVLLHEYDHPGGLAPETLAPSAADTSTTLYLAGLNSSARFIREIVPFESRQHCACAVRLDPPNVDGQAFPYSIGAPTPRDWPALPHATETAYLVIPPIDPEVRAIPTEIIASPTPGSAVRLRVHTSDGRIYTVDDSLRPIECYVSLGHAAEAIMRRQKYSTVLYIVGGKSRRIDVPVVY